MIRWRDLLVAPRARLQPLDGDVTRVEVSGMLCDGACARRVERSLLALPGVTSVEHCPGSGMFSVQGARTFSESEVNRAVQRVVVLRPIRQLLAWLGRRLGAVRE